MNPTWTGTLLDGNQAALQTKKIHPTGIREILPEPQVLLTPSPKLPGLDGRKMSKSLGNHIMLSEPEADIRAKLKVMVTDPARVRRTDPGNPDKCPVWNLHQVYSSQETRDWVVKGCTSAGIGCLECKQPVIDAINAELKPLRERATPVVTTGLRHPSAASA